MNMVWDSLKGDYVPQSTLDLGGDFPSQSASPQMGGDTYSKFDTTAGATAAPANPIPVEGGAAAAGGSAGLTPNVAMQVGGLILDTINKEYAAKNQDAMNRYQAAVAQYDDQQGNIRNLGNVRVRV